MTRNVRMFKLRMIFKLFVFIILYINICFFLFKLYGKYTKKFSIYQIFMQKN